jgi:AAHS family 4-hydroxybenzoate transporter-like MFS transporter
MSLVGWRGVFVGGGVLSLLLLPVAYFMVTEVRGGDAAKVSRSERPFTELVADGRLFGTVLICLSAFLILLVSYFLISWTPTVLTLHGMSPERAAIAGVVLNLGGVLGALAMSILLTGRSPFGPVALCLGIGGVLTVVLGQNILGEAALILALIFAVGAFVIGGQMNFPALGVYFYPEAVRATGVGLAMGVGRLGSIVGPLLGGYLVSAKLGWDQLFLLAGVPAVLAAVAMAAIVLRKPRR